MVMVTPATDIENFLDLSGFGIDELFFEGLFRRIAVIAPIVVDQGNQLVADFHDRARHRGHFPAFGTELREKFGTEHGQPEPKCKARQAIQTALMLGA